LVGHLNRRPIDIVLDTGLFDFPEAGSEINRSALSAFGRKPPLDGGP
jgi:hypothetical protein